METVSVLNIMSPAIDQETEAKWKPSATICSKELQNRVSLIWLTKERMLELPLLAKGQGQAEKNPSIKLEMPPNLNPHLIG